MLNRRLWILFLAFFLGFLALALRLARLQLSGAEEWRARVAQFLHPQDTIETYRGSILDRNGLVLARDVPSDELAIDYRAISLDDTWLSKKAVEFLRATGEWGHFSDRAARNRRLDAVKADLAARIDAIPDVVSIALAPLDHLTPAEEKERLIQRYFEITDRIHAMRQDVWYRKYNRNPSQAPSTGDDNDANDEALDALFRQIQIKDEVASHTLRANLPPDLALFFKQHAADFPGLYVRDQAEFNRRDYPFGPATAHLVGTLRSIDPDTLNAHRFREPNLFADNDPGDLAGYLPGDHIGETGVERIAESLLHGTRGERLLNLGAADLSPASQPAATLPDFRSIKPIPGANVQLTLDAALQRDLYTALDDPDQSLSATALKVKPDEKDLLQGEDKKRHFAALVVLSLDGELLSAVTYPSYDPNTLDANRGTLQRDTYRLPLINRATSAIYHPGSTVKPLLASAALTEHVITPTEEITCTGHFFPSRPDIFKCDATHGPMALVEAISKSCNVYFYTVGQRLGVERLAQWYGNYGFGQDTGMELPEARGNLPRPDKIDPETEKADALFLGIGQGPIDVTPLQLANAYATLLRGGIAIAPRLLASTPVQKTQAVRFAASDLALIRQGMERCTTTGTAKSIFASLRLKVAGKTGTAEKERPVFDDQGNPVDDPARPLLNPDKSPRLKPDGTPAFRQLVERHDDAWFVGYAPADNPQFIVAAILEWGGHGGTHAAPMAREAFLQLQAHGYLPHTDIP